MRITRVVFHDLALWMIAFGLVIGVVFPFFVILLGVAPSIALTTAFFSACLGAGALAGALNFALARGVVGSRVRLLARSMSYVEEHLLQMTETGHMEDCSPEACLIQVDSEDEIGESAAAFNRLVETLARSMETQAAVRSFSETLTSQLELEGLASRALDQFIRHTRALGGAILCESGGELRVVASRGLVDPGTLGENDHVRLAVRTEEVQTIQVPDDLRVNGVLSEFRPSEVCVLPATYKRIPLGVVILATSGAFDPEAVVRMDLFRQTLGLALNNAIAHDRLQRLAALDPLTGVYNRRFGMERLHEEFERAVRMNSPMGLLMFDIDHSKHVNDTYGHLVGDRILVAITAVAKAILRDGDVLAATEEKSSSRSCRLHPRRTCASWDNDCRERSRTRRSPMARRSSGRPSVWARAPTRTRAWSERRRWSNSRIAPCTARRNWAAIGSSSLGRRGLPPSRDSMNSLGFDLQGRTLTAHRHSPR